MFGPTVGHYCKPPSAAPMMHHDALCLSGFQHISKKKGGCQDMFVLFLSEEARRAPDKEARLLPLLQTSTHCVLNTFHIKKDSVRIFIMKELANMVA